MRGPDPSLCPRSRFAPHERDAETDLVIIPIRSVGSRRCIVIRRWTAGKTHVFGGSRRDYRVVVEEGRAHSGVGVKVRSKQYTLFLSTGELFEGTLRTTPMTPLDRAGTHKSSGGVSSGRTWA